MERSFSGLPASERKKQARHNLAAPTWQLVTGLPCPLTQAACNWSAGVSSCPSVMR